jgi:Protein of unknown function, DUF488
MRREQHRHSAKIAKRHEALLTSMVHRGFKPAPMLAAPQRHPTVVLTVGHSTRSQQDFIALLRAHAVKRLVDVRSIPRSRHNPQFNRDRIASAVRRAGISYLHMKDLGGLRHPRSDSLNTAWHNASFRGFADYMQTREFVAGLRKLMKIAKTKRTAIMCAEAVPWRCHRSLIADALSVHGYRVEEIESLKRTRLHTRTPWARVEGTKIIYPLARCRRAGSAQGTRRASNRIEEDGAPPQVSCVRNRLRKRGKEQVNGSQTR